MENRVGIEQIVSPEQAEEQFTSRVLLHLERHGEKAGEDLSAEGRQQMLQKGRSRKDVAPTAVAFGSPRERAQQSAALDMAGAERRDDITGEETLAELRTKLDAGRKVGSRIGIDNRLDFKMGQPAYNEAAKKAFGEKRGFGFTIEESDQLAQALGEKDAFTYSRAAGGIAELVKKYTKVSENFNNIISDPDKLEEYGKVLERFMGSHTPIVDSFLCKVVEKIKGREERDKLTALLGDGGFATSEGYDVAIDMKEGSDQPVVRLKYEKKDEEGHEIFSFNEEIPIEVLDEMIEEGKQ